MLCPQNPEHGHMYDTPRGKFDYYCPNKHGNDEGLFVNEVLENDQWVPKVVSTIKVIGAVKHAEQSHQPDPDGPLLIPDTKKRKRRAK